MTQPTAPSGNYFVNATAGAAAGSTTDNNIFGLTNSDLAAPVVLGAGPPATAYPMGSHALGVQVPGAADLDPFGLGVPIKASGGSVTVQGLLDYIQSLTPDQIGQVQAELGNAGFYGKMNSLTTTPQWGQLTTADVAALGRFAKAALEGAQNGSSVSSVLARATAQWDTEQQNLTSKTPITDFGTSHTITNMDPNQAGDMVDQASMKILGKTLPQAERLRLGGWLNSLSTDKQMGAAEAEIAQRQTDAQTKAQVSDLIGADGTVIDHNGVTAKARSQLGVQYQWGAQSPGKAFDCSGLTQWVYGQNGIKIPRTSQEQWLDPAGHQFNDMSQAQPGDLVFFGGPYGPGHVGIYVGNGMMIDAPHTGSSVRMDNVNSFASSDALVGFKHYDAVGSTSLLGGGGSSNMTSFLSAIRDQESGGNYQSRNSIGASGAYQFMQGTWDTYAKQVAPQWVGRNPADAPAAVQDQVASQMASQLYSKYGNFNDVASAWYSGQPLSKVDPNAPQKGGPSIGDYVSSVMSKMTANGGSPTGAPGDTGSLDANGGRPIISTPDTFTQVTDGSAGALQSSLEAQLRAENPSLAQAHDMTNAYTMLAKSLRDGITVNNS